MSSNVIDYKLDALTVKNPDGSMPATATGCTVTPGPGTVSGVNYANALKFNANGNVTVNLTSAQVDSGNFSLRILFKANPAMNAVEKLAECSLIPFMVALSKDAASGQGILYVDVKSIDNGWAEIKTKTGNTLPLDKWHTLDIVYQGDTLCFMVNGILITSCGVPSPELDAGVTGKLVLGQAIDKKNQFTGTMAAFRLTKDVPDEYTAALTRARQLPDWFIYRKHFEVRNTVSLGSRTGEIYFEVVNNSYVQKFQSGAIQYALGAGFAQEIHGSIYTWYDTTPGVKEKLGALLSDESAAANGGRKSLFTKGGIYWSVATGAVPMYGAFYNNYEQLNQTRYPIGLPKKAETAIASGKNQEMQSGQMYQRDGNGAAYCVHGSILTYFLSKGGINQYGFPLGNEDDVKDASGKITGMVSRFEKGNIYFSGATGAREVMQPLARAYHRMNGPAGPLGWPVSEQLSGNGLDLYQTFQKGLVFKKGAAVFPVCPFAIKPVSVETKEDEGAGAGKNDVYAYFKVKENGVQVVDKRFPNSGYYNENPNPTFDPNYVTQQFTVTDPKQEFQLSLLVKDYDSTSANDTLGTVEYKLNAANGWGWLDSPIGIFNTGPVSKVKVFKWGLKPASPFPTEDDMWSLGNPAGTGELSWLQCAAAFKDIDPQTEWWDLLDWADKGFYEAVVRNGANHGNCYGLSTLAVKSWKNQTRYSVPLAAYRSDPKLWEDIMIHQVRQYGDKAVGYTIDEFIADRTQNPVNAFIRSKAAADRGDTPVLCMTDTGNLLKQVGHCVVPIKWDQSTKPWKITILDCNMVGSSLTNVKTTLYVDPDKNTYTYENNRKYSGGNDTGGRLYHVPYHVFAPHPNTGLWTFLSRIPELLVYGISELLELIDLKGDDGKTLIPDDYKGGSNEFIIPARFNGGTTGGPTLLYRKGGAPLSAAALANLKSAQPDLSSVTLNDAFTTSLKARAAGKYSLLLNQLFSGLTLESNADAGELVSFKGRNMGSQSQAFTFKAAKDRTLKISAVSYLGTNGDYVKFELTGLSAKANADVSIALQPGLSVLDIVGSVSPGAVLSIEARTGNKIQPRTFDLKIDGGTRIHLTEAIRLARISTGKVTSLFGNFSGRNVIKAR